jgi:hypothetical protein
LPSFRIGAAISLTAVRVLLRFRVPWPLVAPRPRCARRAPSRFDPHGGAAAGSDSITPSHVEQGVRQARTECENEQERCWRTNQSRDQVSLEICDYRLELEARQDRQRDWHEQVLSLFAERTAAPQPRSATLTDQELPFPESLHS